MTVGRSLTRRNDTGNRVKKMEEKTTKILLIEDNPDDTELIKRRLLRSANARFGVTAVSTLHDGIAQLGENTPDLIIADLGLPDSHGLDTVKKILSEAPQIPLVVLSGFDDEAIAIKAVQSGAQDYLVKGQMESANIERALFYAIERARLQRELEQHSREICSIQTNLLKILEKNADAIIVVSENRSILFTNPAVETLLGRRQKELINQPFDFPLDGGKTTEIEIARPDGARTIAEMRVVEITWEGKTAYLASLRNITERKRAEEALRASEDRYRNIVELAHDGIITVNTRGVFTSCNPAFLQFIGFPGEEIVGKHFSKIPSVNMKDFPIYAKVFASLLRKKNTQPFELSWRHKDGTIKTCELRASLMKSDGKITGLLAIIIDTTERKKSEQALRESEEKFSKVFRSSPEVIVISRLSDGTMLEANDTFFNITGYTREEVIGKKSSEIEIWAGDEDRDAMAIALKEQSTERYQERKVRMKSGEIRTWLFSADIANINNEPCILTVTTDITERKKTEEALRFSDAAFKSLHESVIATDTQYVITHWNEISAQIYGIEASRAIGKKLLDVIEIVETYPGENDKRFKMLEANGYYQEEQMHRTKHGEVWVNVSFQAIEDGHKRYGWVALATVITQRKMAEEALKRSEEKYREIISKSIDGIISTDQQMRVIIWNRGAEKIYGYTEQEMLGQSLMKIIPEKDRNVLIKGFAKLNKTGSVKAINHVNELTGLKKDGSEISIELSTAIRKSGENYTLTIIVRDITERKQLEQELQQSRNNLLEAQQIARVGSWDWDILTNIISYSDEFHRIFGQHIGNFETFLDSLHPDDRKSVEKSVNEALWANKPYDIDYRIILPNEEERIIYAQGRVTFDNAGKPVRMIGTVQDITERKKAEEALGRSEEKYRTIFENTGTAIAIIETDTTISMVNDEFARITGLTKNDIEGKVKWTDLVHKADLEKMFEYHRLRREGVKVPKEYEFKFHDKIGHVKDASIIVSLIPETKQSLVSMTDISERKKAEEKLRKIDQMKSEFLSNVSHELRTPLQSIGGFTKLIMNGQVPDPTTQQEFLQIIDRETLHLGNLINSLLDLSRLESGRFQVNRKLIPVRDTFIEPVKSFHSLARDKNITLNEDIPEQLPEMEVDGERLRQVVINLLGNAIKFSDPGGSVTVKLAKQPGQLLFQVSDRGIGIPEEAKPHLFERFYRAEGEMVRGGTGLGLYISKQIIEAHGGRIWAESKLGEGSTFNFTLPFAGKGGDGNGKENSGHRRRPGDIKTGRLLTKA